MSLSAVILTYNEAKHIDRCIKSIQGVVENIYVLDSFSSDDTLELLSKHPNVHVKQNKFINYATQFNLAIELFDIKSEWILRIDADEILDPVCTNWISLNLPHISKDINGIHLNRFMTFMGRLMLHGGMSSYWALRIWRNGFGRCEQRWMDEHILLSEGNTVKSDGKLIDDNLNTLSWWAHKHVDYSTREAIDILLKESSNAQIKASFFGNNAERLRFLKGIYNKTPLFLRPFAYFIYRYIIKVGLLDGAEGFLWCVFQGFWYRMMVDAKVYEIKKYATLESKTISEVVKEKYGYEI